MNTCHRLRRPADIARVRSRGRSWSNRHLVLRASAGQTDDSRIALVVSARLGSAVARNLVRRRLREAFRPHLRFDQPCLDLVAVARNELRDASFADVQAAVDDVMWRCVRQYRSVVA